MNKSKMQELVDCIPGEAFSKLETILEQKRKLTESPSEQDKKIIGRLLQALHEAEATLDEAIVMWILPIPSDPFLEALEDLISKIPLRDKIKFANEVGLVDGVESDFQSLQNERNHFAHRRTKGNRPHEKFSNKTQIGFEDKAQKVMDAIRSNLKEKIDVRSVDFINSIIKLIKDFRKSKS